MAGKHINIVPMLIFSSLVMISSSFPADHPVEYQTLVPALLPSTLHTELEALSWDTESQSEHTSTNSPSLSLKLQHVDSLSPQDTSPESLLNNRLKRDAFRANGIFAMFTKSSAVTPRTNAHFSSPVTSGYLHGSGEYFTRIQIGTPAKKVYMVMDTGSDIIWLQCSPCKKCYNQTDKIFNPKNSKSFSRVPCGSPLCDLLENYGKCGKRKQCIYGVLYGDSSVSVGEFSTETLTFGKTKVRKVAFGCGRYNKGMFVAAAGVLGLGRGKLSFPGQTGNKFSYCLATGWGWSSSNKSSSSSHLIFGKKSSSSSAYGKAAVYTPLLKNPNTDFQTFYYVGLERISVGGSLVHGIEKSMFDINRKTGGGGVIVDSGTSVTRLTKSAYVALRDAYRNASKQLKRTSEFFFLDTCYDLSGKKEVKVPTVNLHFNGGANMSLPASNIIIPVDNNGTYCFAFAGTQSDGGLSIIGNIQQQGFGMVFDLARKRVGFAPTAC